MSRYTLREEKANTFTHAIGIPFGLAVIYFLMQKAIPTNNYWLICSTLAYAVFMTFSYVTSTLYHLDKDENRKLLRRKFDHTAIYVHIAGTYTPFTLVVLREQGLWGWTLFGIIWIAAIAGVVMSFMHLKKFASLSVLRN